MASNKDADLDAKARGISSIEGTADSRVGDGLPLCNYLFFPLLLLFD